MAKQKEENISCRLQWFVNPLGQAIAEPVSKPSGTNNSDPRVVSLREKHRHRSQEQAVSYWAEEELSSIAEDQWSNRL